MGPPSAQVAAESLFPHHTMVAGRKHGGPGGGNNGRTSLDFDDLIFLPASLDQRSICQEFQGSGVRLGNRYASRSLELSMPLLLSPRGISSRQIRLALAKAAARLDTAYTTGEAGLIPEEYESGAKVVLQIGPSRFGIIPKDLKQLAAIEIVLPTANHGLGFFLTSRLEANLSCPGQGPVTLDLVMPAPVIDFHNANTLRYKVLELREATDYEIPIFLKAGGNMAEVIRLAAACEVDVVTIDGLQQGFSPGLAVLGEHLGLPTLAALAQAVRTRKDLDLEEDMDLVVTGGIRDGIDAAKCLALGAQAVVLENENLAALDCRVGIEGDTQEIFSRNTAVAVLVGYVTGLVRQVQMITRACGKYDVNHLKTEDLRALSMRTAAITGVALAGSDRILRTED